MTLTQTECCWRFQRLFQENIECCLCWVHCKNLIKQIWHKIYSQITKLIYKNFVLSLHVSAITFNLILLISEAELTQTPDDSQRTGCLAPILCHFSSVILKYQWKLPLFRRDTCIVHFTWEAIKMKLQDMHLENTSMSIIKIRYSSNGKMRKKVKF